MHHKNSPHNDHIWQEYQSKGRALGILKKEKFAGLIFQVNNQVIQNVSLRFCTLAACFGASAHLMQINPPSLSNTLRYEAWQEGMDLNSLVALGQSLALANCNHLIVLYLNICGSNNIIKHQIKPQPSASL